MLGPLQTICHFSVYIIAHWVTKEWELKETLIDFCKLVGPHTGENLAEAFVNCINEFNIATKVYYLLLLFFLILQFYLLIIILFISTFFIILNIGFNTYN